MHLEKELILQRAFNKYGESNFKWEIIKVKIETEEDLSLKEIQTIEAFDSYHNGYNETLGGDGNKLKFSLEFTVALAYILSKYSGVNTKIAKYYGCDNSVINGIKKNLLYQSLEPDQKLVKKIIQDTRLSDDNLNENYTPHNSRKLNPQQCFEILSVILTEKNYDKILCNIYQIDSKLLYRLKKKQIYKTEIEAFSILSEEEKEKIKQSVFQKYNLKHAVARRKRNGVKNPLTQVQINYILDHKDKYTHVLIAKNLGISADRVGAVVLGKSYKDLVENYYSSKK